MPQQTNLNVAPYFDDFDASNDFHKVLFKPGYPVQARELTTLQSILQNQIERFGQHFFKEGAKVIPGNTGYTQLYNCIQLNNNYQGVPVAAYVDQLVGTKITGKNSGVTAVVDKVLLSEDSERDNLTLYINYLNSSTTNNSTSIFADGEEISSNTTITSGLLGNNSISAGDSLAITIANSAAATGSAFQIQDGIYFIRGNFVNVSRETLILDQYSETPSYRVGLFVNEEIINADLDESLNDNSQGYNNYSAPGADRLKITTSLFKKSLDDFDDNNFVELATVENGILKSLKKNTEYNIIADELARRTYDESGDYYVKPFDLTVLDSLNNNVGNRGVFQPGQFTYGGETPTDDLALYKFSPGKAFVRGYEIETISPTFLDVPKPRTTNEVKDETIIYNTGPTLKLNTARGIPSIGIGNTYVVTLRDRRINSSSRYAAQGGEVGVARVYDMALESGSYDASDSDVNEWDISLYDVQMVTDLTVNTAQTLTIPTYVVGQNSGATAFLKDAVTAGTGVTVYESNGSFIPNEKLNFLGSRGDSYGTATVKSVQKYTLSDVKSIYGSLDGTVGINTFNSNVVQSTKFDVGVAGITTYDTTAGIATITSANPNLVGLTTVGDFISYSAEALVTDGIYRDRIYGRVTAINSANINVTTTASITNVNGSIGVDDMYTLNQTVSDLTVLQSSLQSSSDNTLFTVFPKRNVSDVDLTSATISIRKSYDVQILNNQITVATAPAAGANETFLPFDEERYSLTREDGSVEVLTSDKVVITDGTTFLAYNLADNSSAAVAEKATLVATLSKIKPKSKIKIENRVNSVVIDKSSNKASGTGSTTLNDGLTYGNYPFGTRVQDSEISLNVPDVIEIHGVYEAADNDSGGTLSAPTVILTSITSPSTTTAEYVIGEKITGQTSGAIAIVAEKVANSATKISFIYKNDNRFKEGETVVSEESKVNAQVVTLDAPSFNIGGNYTYRTGQEATIYNFGTIKKKVDKETPKRKLKVYFSSAYFESTDDGDITTVDSYKNFNYSTQIETFNGIRNTDMIDIRPRVTAFTNAEDSRSPLEFYGRTFNASGNSAANILASDESILTTFSYYLGRIDRIFLTKNGVFQIKYGTPADKPERPIHVEEAIEIATVGLPPYLYSPKDASLSFMKHKRYRMVDIKKIDDRVKSLEYYTALSLLEANTANLFVPDSAGLNRFKSGFFVDNFSSFQPQEDVNGIKNSLDVRNKELRPRHYTNSVDLIFGPVVNVDETADQNFSTIEGTNVRKQNDVVTLDYAEIEYIKQSFATRSESVTPFLISFWQGTMELTPASDTWVDTVRLDAKIIEVEGNYASTMDNLVRNEGIDPQTGFGPIIWDSWQTNWTGFDQTISTRTRTTVEGGEWQGWMGGGARRPVFGNRTTTTHEDTLVTTVQTGTDSRAGTQTIVTEQWDNESVGDRVVSRDLIAFMRSRNIEFVAKRMKPLTRMYGFFDGEDVTKFCVPKLLEVTMTSGTFSVGETVTGQVLQTGVGEANTDSTASITFRVAQSNHKEGPYDTPTKTYPESPYSNTPLPANYSSTSTVLNVDTYSLSKEAQGEFFGWVETGMILTGKTSGAQATISNVRLVSDLAADLSGSYYLPNPNTLNHPRFDTGTKVFTLINEEDNDQDDCDTIAEEVFTSSGTLETVQENIVSVRNARIEQKQEFQERNVSRDLGTEVVGSRVVSSITEDVQIGWYDPLAQSFLVEDATGVFLTSCEVFFRTKDDMDIPCVFQLRTMKNGFPTQHILPFSEIVLDPNDITTSSDGSVATTINFKAPVYCEPGQEYAIALASNSTKYSVYISRIGENDLLTQTFISNQPYLGSLFKSQNASTWEASQWEDLKFTLYRADFLENGTVETYNPELTKGNNQIPELAPDALNLVSRKVRLALDQSISDGDIRFGNTIKQTETLATGDYVGSAGTATGDLGILNPGIGYTPSSGQVTYSGVNLVTISGNGHGATGDITIGSGVIVASGATIATGSGGGSGYMIGDVLGISTLGSGPFKNIGNNARLTVAGIGSTSEIVVDNVQGAFVTGAGYTMTFNNNAGITTELNWASGGGGVLLDTVDTENDGLHIKVNHKNHGMYFNNNQVAISGAESDVRPTKLTVAYTSGATGAISVASTSDFGTFEKVGVADTNVGFIKIGEEIIEYTSVAGGAIGGTIVRGSNKATYPVGTPVYKYELDGVNLKRINKTHALSDVTVDNPLSFDSYNIKLNMAEVMDSAAATQSRAIDVGFPKLYIGESKSSGGYTIRASQNMPYELITPSIQNVCVRGTTLTGELRSVTASSLSGSEIPWIDVGFEDISINQTNYLDTSRLVASKVNADAQLTTLPGNKSLNLRLFLGTTDSRVSPVIDGQRMSTILTNNRVNSVITNYATDERVNSLTSDPTACQYVSKEIQLENGASSLKVLVAAHINKNCDIRAFYAINNEPGLEPIFVPFPGFDNINDRGEVIAVEDNDGQSDKLVVRTNTYGFDPQSIEYKDYNFTIDPLPTFRTYRIKIVLTSTNQVFVPRMKDLRCIALA